MNRELEENTGKEIRELARNYADGHFNKGEYRQRRRDMLLRCMQLDAEDTQDMPAYDPKQAIIEQQEKTMFWWRMAGVASIALIGVMIFLLYKIS